MTPCLIWSDESALSLTTSFATLTVWHLAKKVADKFVVNSFETFLHVSTAVSYKINEYYTCSVVNLMYSWTMALGVLLGTLTLAARCLTTTSMYLHGGHDKATQSVHVS